jgi:hypothetical protein
MQSLRVLEHPVHVSSILFLQTKRNPLHRKNTREVLLHIHLPWTELSIYDQRSGLVGPSAILFFIDHEVGPNILDALE